jgi:hypothetical protein
VSTFGRLVDKSLVVREPGTGRYRLLETIRVFAGERLDEAGEAAAAFERHRRHVRERIGSASRLDRWMSARLAAELRTDLDDVRQAFCLSLDQGKDDDAVEIAVGASFLWRNAIGCVEGDTWVRRLVALDLTPRDRLWVQILRADVGQGRGDHRQMFGAGASAEALAGRSEDPAADCLAAHYGALAHLTAPEEAQDRLTAALALAHASGDARLTALIEAFGAVADLAAAQHERARATLAGLHGSTSEDGYDDFIFNWTAWMLALTEMDAAAARGWISRQYDFLDRTGIVETWLTSFSTAMCDAIDGRDVTTMLGHTLALADREGYQADADCVLVLAYADMCAGRFDLAAELVGTAVRGRFNATANYPLYQVVFDRALRERLDADRIAEAMARGRKATAADALVAHGIGRRARVGTG